MKKAVAALLALALVGCATVGREVTPDQMARFQKGRTTVTEVVSALGQPNVSSINGSGQRVLVYQFAHAQSRPETFIPFIGPFIGGSDVRGSSAAFIFSPEGILQDYQYSNSTTGMAQGLSAGQYQQPDRSQPAPAN